MGDQGDVVLRFRIFKDGTVVSEEPILERYVEQGAVGPRSDGFDSGVKSI